MVVRREADESGKSAEADVSVVQQTQEPFGSRVEDFLKDALAGGLADATFASWMTLPAPNAHGLRFATPRGETWVLWDRSGAETTELR